MAKYKPNQITFRIDAFTPETLPSAKLAQYLTHLSKLIGSEEKLHFKRIGRGCAILNLWIDEADLANTHGRLKSIGTVDSSPEANKAYDNLNQQLAEDNAVGNLRIGSAKILNFPGRKIGSEQIVGPITQAESLDGQLVRVGGLDETVPVTLREGSQVHHCNTNIETAKKLGQYLFGATIRVFGTATWYRRTSGEWLLQKFWVDNFRLLDDTDLSRTVDQLRAIPIDGWDDTMPEKLNLR
jgi:hypothetical protein